MNFYLDASTIVPLFVPEPTSSVIERWIEAAAEAVYVADLAAAEFAAAISRLVRTQRIADAQATEIVRAFDAWRADGVRSVENLPVDVRTAALLVRKPHPKLLAPDAIHVATCKRLALTLVTYDEALLNIAGREGVACATPA